MAGAAKNRQKKERNAAHNAAQAEKREENHASNTAPVQEPPKLRGGYDGPGDSSAGGPPSRGRPGSTAPSVGQPSRAPPSGPSQGPPSSTGRASSQIRGSSQVRGTSSQMLPDRTGDLAARRYAARYIDLPANAYTTTGGGLGGTGDVSLSLSDSVVVVVSALRFSNHQVYPCQVLAYSLCLVLPKPSITDCITLISSIPFPLRLPLLPMNCEPLR